MTFPRYEELKAYWKQQPPTHILVDLLFNVLGCPLKKEDPPKKNDGNMSGQQFDDSLDNLIADFTKAGGRI